MSEKLTAEELAAFEWLESAPAYLEDVFEVRDGLTRLLMSYEATSELVSEVRDLALYARETHRELVKRAAAFGNAA